MVIKMEKVDKLLLERSKNLISDIIEDNKNKGGIKALRQYCIKNQLSTHYGTCLKKMSFVVFDGEDNYIVNPATEIDLFTNQITIEQLAITLVKYVKIYKSPKVILEETISNSKPKLPKKESKIINIWRKYTSSIYSLFQHS